MHRTYSALQRLMYVILSLIALTGLVDGSPVWLASQTMPLFVNVFHIVSSPVLFLVLVWSVWAWITRRTPRSGLARVVVTAITILFLGDLGIRLATYEGTLIADVYQAYFWKVLVLCLAYPMVFPYRWGLVAIGIVTALTAAMPVYVVLRVGTADQVWPSLVQLGASYVGFAAGLMVVLLLGHTKQAYLQIDREMQSMRRLAQTDPLTDVWNRRRLHDAFHEAVEQGRTPLTVIMFDIDSFKEINDAHGHQVGDRVLITTTHLAQGLLRSEDSIGRWGGEEFIVLCPATTLSQGTQMAERIRRAISSHVFEGVGTITASFGVAQYREGETVEELVARADKVLYVAKDRGKNCVEVATSAFV